MANPLIDFDLESFDPLAQKPQAAPVPQQQNFSSGGGGSRGGNLLDFGDFGDSLPNVEQHDDHGREKSSSRRSRNKYDDDEEEEDDRGRGGYDSQDEDDGRRHRRSDSVCVGVVMWRVGVPQIEFAIALVDTSVPSHRVDEVLRPAVGCGRLSLPMMLEL